MCCAFIKRISHFASRFCFLSDRHTRVVAMFLVRRFGIDARATKLGLWMFVVQEP